MGVKIVKKMVVIKKKFWVTTNLIFVEKKNLAKVCFFLFFVFDC